MRILLYFVGWLLILAGLAALVLPGPGVLALALGAAALSLASEAVHRRLRRPLERHWPEGAERLDSYRGRIADYVNRFGIGRSQGR